MNEIIFKEEQRFTQKWVYVLLSVAVIISIVSTYLFAQQKNANIFYSLLPLIPGVLLFCMFAFAKLKTSFTALSISYQFVPFNFSRKNIERESVQSITFIQYTPLQFGGWGIRYVGNGWAYLASGHEAVKIILKNEKEIIVGTNNSRELISFLQKNWSGLFSSSS